MTSASRKHFVLFEFAFKLLSVSLLSIANSKCSGNMRPVRMMKGRVLALFLITQSEDNTASLAAACAKYYSDSDGYHPPA